MQLAVNALLTMAMHLGSYGLSNAILSERVRTGELIVALRSFPEGSVVYH
jgi:hypothetical protein